MASKSWGVRSFSRFSISRAFPGVFNPTISSAIVRETRSRRVTISRRMAANPSWIKVGRFKFTNSTYHGSTSPFDLHGRRGWSTWYLQYLIIFSNMSLDKNSRGMGFLVVPKSSAIFFIIPACHAAAFGTLNILPSELFSLTIWSLRTTCFLCVSITTQLQTTKLMLKLIREGTSNRAISSYYSFDFALMECNVYLYIHRRVSFRKTSILLKIKQKADGLEFWEVFLRLRIFLGKVRC